MFKVLIVDDDEVVCLFLGRLLTNKFDCQVISADNGLEALEIIEKETPDVVFLDITMPVMDGIETLEVIRKDPKFKKLPVIMLTALKDKGTVSNVMNLGVMAYLLKPLQYNSAYEKIKEIFEQIKRDKKEMALVREAGDDAVQKILVVDYDEEFRGLIKRKLEKAFTVFESASGAEGLKVFMKEMPNIVFLGENLPLLNEKRLAQKINEFKKSNGSRNLEVFVCLIKEDEIVTDEEKELFDSVIQKNQNVGVFLKTLGDLIKQAYM